MAERRAWLQGQRRVKGQCWPVGALGCCPLPRFLGGRSLLCTCWVTLWPVTPLCLGLLGLESWPAVVKASSLGHHRWG